MIKDAIEDAASLERTGSNTDHFLNGYCFLEKQTGGVMSKCECTMAIRVNGDGCRYCQPQEHIDRLTDWINEARDEIAALAKERKDLEYRLSAAEAKIPKWIPVKERLPKPGATVLAVDNSGDMGVCNFVNAKFIGECFGFESYLNDGGWDCSASKVIGEYVTHWMPLPEPPNNEENAG